MSAYRAYARAAAIAFLLVAVYTVAVKIARGELADDWVHSALHVATGAFALYAGWAASGAAPARALTLAVAVVYGVLGLAGWFVDGLLTDTTYRIPLAAGDNVFHLALAAGAALAHVVARGPSKPASRPRDRFAAAHRRGRGS